MQPSVRAGIGAGAAVTAWLTAVALAFASPEDKTLLFLVVWFCVVLGLVATWWGLWPLISPITVRGLRLSSFVPQDGAWLLIEPSRPVGRGIQLHFGCPILGATARYRIEHEACEAWVEAHVDCKYQIGWVVIIVGYPLGRVTDIEVTVCATHPLDEPRIRFLKPQWFFDFRYRQARRRLRMRPSPPPPAPPPTTG